MVLKRIQKAQKQLEREGVDALIVDNTTDLYYLTGMRLSWGRMVIEREEATLFVDGRYWEAAQKQAPCKVALRETFSLKPQRVGFDASKTSFQEATLLQKETPHLVALEAPIKKIRAIKEEREIELLQKAAVLGSKGYDYVLDVLEEGKTEREVAAELEIFWLQQGGERVSFDPIIAFGSGSSQPHYRAGEVPLKKGDTVLIDIGVMREGYASDMTRVIFFKKEPSPQMEEIYRVVKEAHLAAVKACAPGVKLRDLDAAARDVIEKAGFGPYFPHSLGHGVGLEVHELPVIKAQAEEDQVLMNGMVFTIEPGIYLPGIGGVRLEDTVVLREGKVTSLTNRNF